ncbi:hypothetical protein GcC1_191032 [Golovinomyces cichoracearum]|uniref:FAR1 domain-containing protein n=1 Tax=Golovinomyces cichoracearum TaxID=62708 RepID=A0A420HID9_9PEZI|nr:hypothetical protein GcC1_191032 [Golovinomyces cichoracearum]
MDKSLSLGFLNGEYNLFSSELEAFLWAQVQANIGGYAFSNLYKNKSRVRNNLILSCCNCDKGPKIYQEKPKITLKLKQRERTGSKKCGRIFRITIKLNDDKQWEITSKNTHNHCMNTSSTAHPAHRAAALPKTLREEILLSSKAGLSIGQI